MRGKAKPFPAWRLLQCLDMVQFDNTYNEERVAEMRRAEEESLITQLAKQYGYQYINLPGITINPQALTVISEQEAKAANAVAFERKNKSLSVAIRNPNKPETKQLLTQLQTAGWKLTLYMCSTASLEHGWKRYEDQRKGSAVKRGVLDINPDQINDLMRSFKTLGDVTEHIQNIRTLNSARRVSETLESVFAGALALGASDVHIEPEETNIRLRYRLDGVLKDVLDMERVIYERLISRLKLLAGMRLNIHDEAQDGRFSFTIGERDVEVRASNIPGAAGESLVMRLLDPSVASFQFANLGLNAVMKRVMLEELARPNGLIITTGPTGSGKTTALYAFLQQVHTEDRKIITIEDPVEYKIDDIVQTQVSDDYSFASGLRAILRQDPDVIMIGEIRDREVAETALHAAQTGHLVFSTLHTNSAVGAFPRLIDLGVDYRTLGSSVNIILGQRLVRVLCDSCKEAYTASAEEVQIINDILKNHPEPPPVQNPFTLYKPVGCAACNNSGFFGRQGIYEAVQMDDAVEEAVLRDPREHIIHAAAKNQGIPTMAEDGIEKVIAGITSLTELERVIDLHEASTAADPTTNASEVADHTV